MARGYPDFFGTSIFPGYGLPLSTLDVAVVIPALTEVDIISLALKGSIGLGLIYLEDLVTIEDVTLQAVIDGAVHFEFGIDNLYNILTPLNNDSLFSLSYLNRETQKACILLKPGLQLGQTFVVKLNNGLGTDIESSVSLLYYRVE
jgi:hypothetical protein